MWIASYQPLQESCRAAEDCSGRQKSRGCCEVRLIFLIILFLLYFGQVSPHLISHSHESITLHTAAYNPFDGLSGASSRDQSGRLRMKMNHESSLVFVGLLIKFYLLFFFCRF
jgi:hypothetical protein